MSAEANQPAASDSSLTRIGLLGGMSWQSTAVYYRRLNESIQQRVGGHASAPLIVWSVDFAEIERYQRAGDWDSQGRILAAAAAALEAAGSQAIALATNTLHLVAGRIVDAIGVPLIDLIDVAGQGAADRGFGRVGLLATGYTMRSTLYPERLAKFGVEVIVPEPPEQDVVHGIIYDELVRGVVTQTSRQRYLDIIQGLAGRGAQAVILGCTEVGLLLSDGDADVPLLDTTALHCQALTDIMIGGVRR
jgi:aspartate racemase